MDGMKTASIRRRFGDWLGVVPEEETSRPAVAVAAADTVSPGELEARQIGAKPESVLPEPERAVMSFRDVVNQRRQLSR
jgi:hypothetical protein